jgi:hypothetical protein
MISNALIAQRIYFQQELSYDIQVRIDDRSHILRGYEKITYINRSPDSLKFIFMHIWPNAYRNDRNEFTRQQVENGETDFYYSKKSQRGFIDSLQFKVDDLEVGVSDYNNYADVVVLELNAPLAPGAQMIISTPFRVVLPEIFSRMGHDNNHYCITQWYPKPAVYDHKGWHPYTYLDQGEFYGEFARYDVEINLPKDYVVASTGILQTESEKEWLLSKTNMPDSLFVSNSKLEYLRPKREFSSERKTIRFKQDQVHDFAWFASRDYCIQQMKLPLNNGRSIDCMSFYFPWKRNFYKGSEKLLASCVKYLSEKVGEYPYGQISVVDGRLAAGAGMEYPMVAVLGNVLNKEQLYRALAHEVAHNWFYGILASDERAHPWMDESLTTFYEQEILSKISDTNAQIYNLLSERTDKLIYLTTAGWNESQAGHLHSEAYSHLNYGGILYEKLPAAWRYLQAYLGDSTFNRCIQSYYTKWRYKHPYPEDIENVITQNSGKDLSWFFDGLLRSDEQIDFSMKGVKGGRAASSKEVFVKGRTNFQGPIPVDALKNGKVVDRAWVSYPYQMPALLPAEADEYRIDVNHDIPERRLNNNVWRNKSLRHKNPFRLKTGLGINLSRKNEMFLLPAFGYNAYDRFMAGGLIHNLRLPARPFQFVLAPMYSFKTQSAVGTGMLAYHIFPRNYFKRISLALHGNSFHHDQSDLNLSKPLYLRHQKLAPSVQFVFKPSSARSTVQNSLMLKYYYIGEEAFRYQRDLTDSLIRPEIISGEERHLGRLVFLHQNKRTLNPYSYNLDIQANQQFLKIGLTAELRIDYHIPDRAFYVRAFGGKFFEFDPNQSSFGIRNQYLTATYTGNNDWIYDGVYLDRNAQSGWKTQQIAMQEGGLKIRTLMYASPLGRSDNWLASVNLRSDLPFSFPLKLQLFFDAATFANAAQLNPSGNKVLFDGGIQLNMFKERLVVYLPLIMSKDFKDYSKSVYSKNRMLQNMSFALRFHPFEFMDQQKEWLQLLQ